MPKPVQKPHPPLWVACSRARDDFGGASWNGALTFAFIDPEEADGVHDYEQTLADRCVPIGKAVNPQVACVTPMMLHPDERTAIARGLEGGNFFGYSLSHYYLFGDHCQVRSNVWEEFQKSQEMGYDRSGGGAATGALGAKVERGAGARCSGHARLREYLRRYEDAGVDQVIFVMQAGKNRHEHIMEALELFGKDVLPEFKERDAAFRKKKAERLAPVIEAAMQHRAEPASQMPEDYVMEALNKRLIVQKQGEEALGKIASQTALGGPRPRLDDLVKP